MSKVKLKLSYSGQNYLVKTAADTSPDNLKAIIARKCGISHPFDNTFVLQFAYRDADKPLTWCVVDQDYEINDGEPELRLQPKEVTLPVLKIPPAENHNHKNTQSSSNKVFGEDHVDTPVKRPRAVFDLFTKKDRAIVTQYKPWYERDSLFVHFMNEEVLEDWTCGNDSMTSEMILKWAQNAWNSIDLPGIPKLEVTSSIKHSHIRVKFSDDDGVECQSEVGTDALRKEFANKPTMHLNLRLHHRSLQESLVIHEFGHASGLEHEHDHPDFWFVAKDLVDVGKMMEDPQVTQNPKEFMKLWEKMIEPKEARQRRGENLLVDYDPNSIMHYWMNVKWLRKQEHMELGCVDDTLSEAQQKCLKGFHARTKKKQLTRWPSNGDKKRLLEAYETESESASSQHDIQSKITTDQTDAGNNNKPLEEEKGSGDQAEMHVKPVDFQPTPSGSSSSDSKFWLEKEELKVYFMNETVLNKWRCGEDQMTTSKILVWVKGAWNSYLLQEVPKFTETKAIAESDVRVFFTDNEGCWSMVGTDAERVKGKPTMQLNLRGFPPTLQESLVIHEFGHVLGLEHEHERSDFLEVAMDLIDKEKMDEDPRWKSFLAAGFKKQWKRVSRKKDSPPEEEQQLLGDYDPDSIMHFWFDIEWLRDPRHKSVEYVLQNPSNELSEMQQKCLKGFHNRSARKQLSYAPSSGDIKALSEVYGSEFRSLADGLKSRNFEDGQVSKLIAFAKKLKLRGFETGEISKLIEYGIKDLDELLTLPTSVIHEVRLNLSESERVTKLITDLRNSKPVSTSSQGVIQSEEGDHAQAKPGLQIWKGKSKLMVHFMNPDFLEEGMWRCGAEPMTTATILAWARVWNTPFYEYIPRFELTEFARRADIRVRFSDDSVCWSWLGPKATLAPSDKPTMVLNLRGLSPKQQESVVVNEFRHALGLEHEHDPSDFWEVIGSYERSRRYQDQLMQWPEGPSVNDIKRLAKAYGHDVMC